MFILSIKQHGEILNIYTGKLKNGSKYFSNSGEKIRYVNYRYATLA